MSLRLEDVYPTGEYRAPRAGELYVSFIDNKSIIICSRDEGPGYQRIIVKERHAGAFPMFDERGLRGSGAEAKLLHDIEQARAELDESERVHEDAHEAALLALTKIALDDNASYDSRIRAAETLLGLQYIG